MTGSRPPRERPTTPHRQSLRGGTTLTEVMTVVVIVMFIASSLGFSWQLLARTQQRIERGIAERQQAERLAYRFRLDARDAVRASVVPEDAAPNGADQLPTSEPPSTELRPAHAGGWDLHTTAGGTIEYRRTRQGIERQVRQGDQIVQRDVFRLPRDSRVSFVPPESAAGPARLVLARAPLPAPGRPGNMDSAAKSAPDHVDWLVIQATLGPAGKETP